MALKTWIKQARHREDPDEILELGMYRNPLLSPNLTAIEKEELAEAQIRWRTGSGRRSSASTSASNSRRAEYSGSSHATSSRRSSTTHNDRSVSSEEPQSSSSSKSRKSGKKSEKIGAGLMGVFYAGSKARESAAASIELASSAVATKAQG